MGNQTTSPTEQKSKQTDRYDYTDEEWMTMFWRRVSFHYIPLSFLQDGFLEVKPGQFVIQAEHSICIDLTAITLDGQV